VVKRRQQNRVTFKFSNVVVNARAMIQAIDDLEPLAAVMPADADEQRTYVHVSCRAEISVCCCFNTERAYVHTHLSVLPPPSLK